MEKNELKNAGHLTRIKLKNEKRILLIGAFGMGFLPLTNLFGFLTWLYSADDRVGNYYQWPDSSMLLSYGILIAIIVINCFYRTDNQNYAVYPQTNTTRFLSAQALFYALIAFFGVVLLASYLIQYSVVAAIASGNKSIHLIYHFDIGFVVAGFFTLIVYLSLIAALISLVATLVRKFRIYAIAVFIVIAGILIAQPPLAVSLFRAVFGFLIYEHSVMFFFLKGIVLWAVLFILSLIVNKFTVYYRDSIRLSKRVAVGICLACIFTVAIFRVFMVVVVPIALSSSERIDYIYKEPSTIAEDPDMDIIFDISDLPKGSKINIVTTNIFDETTGDTFFSSSGDMRLSYDVGALSSVSGNKLIVSYTMPMETVNQYDIASMANPKLSARLEGDTLYLDYTYDENVKAVFIPVWSFMWQFDHFKGKGIFNESFWETGSHGGGGIYIEIE